MTTAVSVAEQLADLLGSDCVAPADRLVEYAIGSFVPTAVVKPDDAGGVRAVMEWASRTRAAVYPSGGRTLTQLGNRPSRPGIALDLTGLNRLVDFQPADLTVSVEAGMTIAQLDDALAQDGKHVPIAAPLPRRATVGGTLATGVSGPLRSAYGLPRDWLIGINVVGCDGTATKAGGKVVKNVTGYDLNRLYTGSLGTIGVITEATFKLAPAPGDWAVIVGRFSSAAAAVAAGQTLERNYVAPLGSHLLTGESISRVSPSATAGEAVAVAIVGGRAASVNRRVNDTSNLWRNAASSIDTMRGDTALDLINALTDLPVGPESPPNVSVRINSTPSALNNLVDFGRNPLGIMPPPAVVADVGFGGGRLLWWDDFDDADAVEVAGELRKIQDTATTLGGGAIVERCPQPIRDCLDVWGDQPSGMAIMRRLKQQFDPHNILNPGRFIGGL